MSAPHSLIFYPRYFCHWFCHWSCHGCARFFKVYLFCGAKTWNRQHRPPILEVEFDPPLLAPSRRHLDFDEVPMKHGLLAVLCGGLIATIAAADDWPQFRGPERSGISKEKGLLRDWPKAGPKLAWTFKDAGLGFSSVAVVKGVVYTLGTDAKFTEEQIIAIDEKKGTELWRVKLGPLYTYKGNTYGDGPRSTPTVDGNFLYALGGEGQLVCVDVTQKGKEVWRKHLIKDLGGVMMDRYGVSESVLIDGKHLIR